MAKRTMSPAPSTRVTRGQATPEYKLKLAAAEEERKQEFVVPEPEPTVKPTRSFRVGRLLLVAVAGSMLGPCVHHMADLGQLSSRGQHCWHRTRASKEALPYNRL